MANSITRIKDQSMSLAEKMREYLDSKTDEELSKEWDEMFPPENDPPKGWVSIEDHLPEMYAIDIMKGYSKFKVKYADGHEDIARVGDHNVWYYIAKESGITHWFNE